MSSITACNCRSRFAHQKGQERQKAAFPKYSSLSKVATNGPQLLFFANKKPPLLTGLAILGALLAAHGCLISVQSGQPSDLFRLRLFPGNISLFTLPSDCDDLKIPTKS